MNPPTSSSQQGHGSTLPGSAKSRDSILIAANFLLRVLVTSLVAGLGVVYANLVEKPQALSNVSASAIAATFVGVNYLASAVSTWLNRHEVPGWQVFAGVLMASSGLALSSIKVSFTSLVSCYGILGGIGTALTNTVSFLIVQTSLGPRRAMANKFASFGSSLSFLATPLVILALIQHLSLRGSFLIWSSIVLQGIIVSMVYLMHFHRCPDSGIRDITELSSVELGQKSQKKMKLPPESQKVKHDDEITLMVQPKDRDIITESAKIKPICDEMGATQIGQESDGSDKSQTENNFVSTNLASNDSDVKMDNGEAEVKENIIFASKKESNDCYSALKKTEINQPDTTLSLVLRTQALQEHFNTPSLHESFEDVIDTDDIHLQSLHHNGQNQKCMEFFFDFVNEPTDVFKSTFTLNSESFQTMKSLYFSMEDIFYSVDNLAISSSTRRSLELCTRNHEAHLAYSNLEPDLDVGIVSFLRKSKRRQIISGEESLKSLEFPKQHLHNLGIRLNWNFLVYSLSSAFNKHVYLSLHFYLPAVASHIGCRSSIPVLLTLVVVSELATKFAASYAYRRYPRGRGRCYLLPRSLQILVHITTSFFCLAAVFSTRFWSLAIASVGVSVGTAFEGVSDPILLMDHVPFELWSSVYWILRVAGATLSFVLFPIQGLTVDLTGKFRGVGWIMNSLSLASALLWLSTFCGRPRTKTLGISPLSLGELKD